MKNTHDMLMSIVPEDMYEELSALSLEQLSIDYQYLFEPQVLAVAFDKLYLMMIQQKVKYFTISEEDLASMALVTLDKCLQLFKPNRGFKFTTFFHTALENELKRTCIKSNKENSKANLETAELDVSLVGEVGVEDSYEHLIPDGLLNEREQYICWALVQGHSIAEIANHFGVCSTRVSKIKKGLTKKLSFLLG